MSTEKSVALDESYDLCDRITAERARNFHFAFSILPKERYKSICALYAFTRTADDLSDDEVDPVKALANSKHWRGLFDAALAGDTSGHAILPALADTFRKYKIPPIYMHDLITGTEMDARQSRYAVWKDTYLYCYRVASVIGIMTIHVFGFDDPRAVPLAEKMGIAFQMTNILRDIKEDSERGRIYLPQEDLATFKLEEPAFLRLHRFAGDAFIDRIRDAARVELLPRRRAADRDDLSGEPRRARQPGRDLQTTAGRNRAPQIRRARSQRVSLGRSAEKLSLAAGLAWKKFLKFGS